jgi:thiosulfate dehydrogenase
VQAKNDFKRIKTAVKVPGNTLCFALIASVCMVIAIISSCDKGKERVNTRDQPVATASSRKIPAGAWKAPDSTAIPTGKTGDMIRYGKELLGHTARYFGPNGSVAKISNGMNCQNCHLDGGRRLFGNNYASFIATYPKMNNRSGKIDQPTDRIVQCFNRSLAGRAPDTNGREVRAMLAYMKWIGQGVKKGRKLFGAASEKLAYMDQPANPFKGKAIFMSKCKICHGSNGEGLLAGDKKSYTYPPLWGEHSYNNGAGMYRIGNLAGFVKNNMPFGATYQSPQLTDEEAWNVAAFVNSQPRPHFDQRKDWRDLKTKPVDFPFGPYSDRFSEKQHKYGPFKPIAAAQKELANKKS